MANSVMRFILEGRDNLSRVLDNAGDAAGRLQRRLEEAERRSNRSTSRMRREAVDLRSALIALAPAAVPVGVALVPIAAHAGAAGAALAAFRLAVAHQITSLQDAAEAEKTYSDAAQKSGATSEEAVAAQIAYHQQIQKMPPATRQASAALSVLRDTYQKWSDSLAADTMPVFTKGLEVANALLPKTSGLVKGASAQLDRMVTIAAGGFASPGFDRLVDKFTAFSTSSLKQATDGMVHFLRVLSEGHTPAGLTEFMDRARALGPQVAETLKNIGRALGNVLAAATGVGGGMLQVVNVFARLLAAIPTGLLTALLQVATTLKLIALASAGLKAARAGLVSLAAGALTASERMGRLRAAIVAMSAASKAALAASGIGLLMLAIGSLVGTSKKAPDVDRMTTALGRLAQTGKASGEAARVFGKDLGGLYDSVRSLTDPSGLDKAQQSVVRFLSLGNWDSTPVQEAKEKVDGIDKALANLVRGGHADQAAIALDILSKRYAKGGHSAGELRSKLDDYKSALADTKFEQELAAQAMGLFGQSASDVQEKLNAQKLSADGLRQSYQALSTAALEARGGIRGMEAAIDAASDAVKKNGKTLDENTAKGRANNQALDDIASSTMRAAASARENGSSWSTVSGIYDKGRGALIKFAKQMGLGSEEAKKLADQILKVPDKTVFFKGEAKDLKQKISDAQKKVDDLKQKRKVAVGAEKRELDEKVRAAQKKVDSLRQKRAAALNAADHTHNGVYAALRSIGKVKSKTVYITSVYRSVYYTAKNPKTLGAAHGRAHGGPIGRYAGGGQVQGFPGGGAVFGPGTSLSDSIPAFLSNGEYVIRAAAVRKYGMHLFDRLNGMHLPGLAGRITAARTSTPTRTFAPRGHGSPINIVVNGAMDPVAVGKQIRKVLLELKRTHGVNVNLGVS